MSSGTLALAPMVVRASGRGRALLVVGTTALNTGLLLVAISITRIPRGSYRSNGPATRHLLVPIADPGTRPGVVLAVVLLTIPVLLLLDQAVRLGSTTHQRRYRALFLAGATPGDLRAWAVLEVAAPALAGALLGVPVWWLMRQVLGHGLESTTGALVPTAVGPGVWAAPLVLAVTAYGAGVGLRAGSRTASASTRGGERRPPRGWPLLLVVVGAAVLTGRTGTELDTRTLPVTLAAVVSIVTGIVGAAPWIAYLAAGAAVRRAETAPVLLAARRILVDPGPAGRSAAAVGGVALTSGVLVSLVADLSISPGYSSEGSAYVSAALVAVCAFFVLAIIALSLSVHSVESTQERRREMAALTATGVPQAVLTRALRYECLITTQPLALLGGLLGAIGYPDLVGSSAEVYLVGLLGVAGTMLAVALAVGATTRILEPWLVAATDPRHLRTE